MKKHSNTNKNKGLDTLSKLSGISKKTMREIWATVKENHKLLDGCSFHIFKTIDDPGLSRRFMCENCKGTVSEGQKIWYEKGIEHILKRDQV